jgi:hypothetical protein
VSGVNGEPVTAASVPFAAIENTAIVPLPLLPVVVTIRNLPKAAVVRDTGRVPTVNGEPFSSVSCPVELVNENAEIVPEV